MVQIGCLANYLRKYEENVAFAQDEGFDLMQVWYDNRGICLHQTDADPLALIKQHGFPTIIHAVLDVNEFAEHIPPLAEILTELEHTELIIHPICQSEEITCQTIEKLSEKVGYAIQYLKPYGIQIFLENNSRLDPIFTTTEEIQFIFQQHPDLEFLLDIAHIDDYQHLEEMVRAKKPGKLHIADRHLDVIHEHLPIGQGEMDYPRIFKEILPDFQGQIILEIIQSQADLVHSRKVIQRALNSGV